MSDENYEEPDEESTEDALDNDELSAEEDGFLRGYEEESESDEEIEIGSDSDSDSDKTDGESEVLDQSEEAFCRRC